jgi:predicted PurR-regulated permease PerM
MSTPPRYEGPAPTRATPVEGEPLDITRITGRLRGPLGAIAVSTTGLFILAFFYTLFVGREFFLPITVAVMLNFLLTPAVRGLKRVGLPPPVGAAVILLLFFGLVGYGAYRVTGPAMEWLERSPALFTEAEERLRSLREPVEAIQEAGEQVEALARGDEGARTERAETESESMGLSGRLFRNAGALLVGGSVSVFLLYFLLALDDLFLRKLAGVLPRLSQRRKAVLIARATERDLSHYVLVRTATNVGLGLAVGVATWLLGMPNPVLWGILAGVLNYIPYVGGVVGYVVVGVVALTTFDTTARALLVPAVYLVLNIVESNFVTPAILGRELTLNPVMIFTWLIFWGWMWGVPGALMAIPLLAMAKIVADNVESLAPLGAFLGR